MNMENVILSLATIIAKQEREIEALRRSESNGPLVTQSWMDGTWADINALRSPSMSKEAEVILQRALEVVERNGGMDPAEREARAVLSHPTPDGCGWEGKQIEAAARAIADAWGETWECCCTEQRGLDCDCGDAMTDEREEYDERLSREDCRMAARAALSALSALTAGVPEQAVPDGRQECTTEGCDSPVGVYFERGGVGSHYCRECYLKVQALPAAPTAGGDDG